MKKIILTASIFIMLFCASVQIASAKIKDLKDPQKALDIAINENKVVMYIVWATWCPGSSRLENRIISDNKFERYARDHIAYVSITIGKNGVLSYKYKAEYIEILKKYESNAVPTMILVNPNNDKFEIITGTAYDVEGYIKIIDKLLASSDVSTETIDDTDTDSELEED